MEAGQVCLRNSASNVLGYREYHASDCQGKGKKKIFVPSLIKSIISNTSLVFY